MPSINFEKAAEDNVNNLDLSNLVKRIRMVDCEPWIREHLVKFVQFVSNLSNDDGEMEIPPYDREILKLLKSAGWDPNNKNTGGIVLIRNAIRNDDVYHFNMLLEYGFNHKTPGLLQWTCESQSVIIFNRLMKFKNAIDKNENGCKPLYSACFVGNYYMAETLLNRAVAVNGWQDTGTALHAACFSGNVYLVGLLIKRGILVDLRNIFGETALHLACKLGKIDIVRLLIRCEANINITNIASHTPLHLAVYNDEIETAELLIGKGAAVNSNVMSPSPLFISCLQKHPIRLLVKMIAAGADVNSKNIKNMTPLHAAVYKNYSQAVDLLLANGADINAKDAVCRTPMKYAVKFGFIEIIKILLTANKSVVFDDLWSNSSRSDSIEYDENEEERQNIDIIKYHMQFI